MIFIGLKFFIAKSAYERVFFNTPLFLYLISFILAKCARDMVFRVMSQEEETYRVLNYAPGPLDTPMLEYVRANVVDPELRNMFFCKFTFLALMIVVQIHDVFKTNDRIK